MIILFLLFIIGFLIVNSISTSFSVYEKVGFSFPIGLGISSFLMFLFTILKIKITLLSLFLGILIIAGFLGFLIYYQKKIKLLSFHSDDKPLITLSWILCFGLLSYFLYAIGMKCFYFLPAEYDSLTGYDLLAKTMAAEGTFKTSIFDYPYLNAYGIARFIYPPYVANSFATAYISGLENSKIVIFLLFLSFILVFYGLIRKKINDTWALFFTTLMAITPEMFSHAALALTNLPNGILTSISVICILFYFSEREKKYLFISLIFMILSNWSRSDSIVYVMAMVILFILDFKKNKEWKLPLIYILISFLPFIIWSIYLKTTISNADSSQFFVKHIFWDYDKFTLVFGKALILILGNGLYFGITFYIAVVIIALNTVDIITKQIPLAIFILTAWFGYTLLYYQMDYSFAGNIDAYINASYKRGMFNFVPLCWFFVATSPFSEKWINKIDKYIYK